MTVTTNPVNLGTCKFTQYLKQLNQCLSYYLNFYVKMKKMTVFLTLLCICTKCAMHKVGINNH